MQTAVQQKMADVTTFVRREKVGSSGADAGPDISSQMTNGPATVSPIIKIGFLTHIIFTEDLLGPKNNFSIRDMKDENVFKNYHNR